MNKNVVFIGEVGHLMCFNIAYQDCWKKETGNGEKAVAISAKKKESGEKHN